MLMQTFSKFRKMEVNMKSLKELLNFKTNKKVRIAVACPEDYEVLSAIFEAYELDMGLFSLFGNVSKIKSIAQEIGKDIPSDFLLVDATDGQLACQLAVKAVSQGEAQILMKGLIDTSVILKEALNKEYGIRTDKILSHVMVLRTAFLKPLGFIERWGHDYRSKCSSTERNNDECGGTGESIGICPSQGRSFKCRGKNQSENAFNLKSPRIKGTMGKRRNP
jgi:hypothetical protein